MGGERLAEGKGGDEERGVERYRARGMGVRGGGEKIASLAVDVGEYGGEGYRFDDSDECWGVVSC